MLGEGLSFMENLLFSFNVVMPVFLVIGLGYFLKRIKLVDDHFVDVAVKMNFRVALPVLIFNNIYTSDFEELFDVKLMGFALAAIIGSLVLLCLVIPRFVKDRKRASAIIHGGFRSNFLLLGLPLAINMFGAGNVHTVTALIPVSIPAFNVMAVVLLSHFDDDLQAGGSKFLSTVKGVATNPLVIASVIAMLMHLFSLSLPSFLEKSVTSVAIMATPLALLTLGAQLNFKNVRDNIKYTMVAVLCKLVIIPVVVVALAAAVGFRGYELGGMFILFSAPSAISCFVMSKEMHSDHALTADIILVSTFLSMFTIFLGIYTLKSFALI